MLPNGSRNYSDGNLKGARRLRTEMSVSEQTLWAFIRKDKLGFRFRRQVPIGVYVLDFYCPEAKLCVEVDGEQHGSTQVRDAHRDRELSALGILTIRLPSLDLFTPEGAEFSYWLNLIAKTCEERAGRVVWPTGLHL